MSSGWFPRLSFDGKHVASGHLDITVDGQVIANDGLEPVWLDNTTVLFRKQTTGALMRWDGPGAAYPVSGPTGIGGNQVAAGGGRWAVYRTDPPRIIPSDGGVWLGVSDPGFSDDGQHDSFLDHDTGEVCIDGSPRGTLGRIPRWGSTSLCWELNGAIFGIVTPGQRVTPLTILPRQYKPVPVWTGSTLLVLSHGDANVYLQLWGSNLGWVVTTGETDGPHDARPFDATHVRVVWSVGGVLKERTIDISTQAVDLTAAPPVDPPPVETLPDIPWTSDPIGTPFDISALWLASATARSGNVFWFRKGDPVLDDPQGAVGAWFDWDPATKRVGLWLDSSTGRLFEGPAGHLVNDWMYFDKARLWFPLVEKSSWETTFDSVFVWRHGSHDPVRMRVVFEVGRAVFHGGVEVAYRHTYDASVQDGDIEYSYYDAKMIERRWEYWRRHSDGTFYLAQATQPVPVTGPEVFVAPPVAPIGPILPSLSGEPKPSITIRSDYGPKQGKAPHTWEATAITTGKITRIEWRWRKQGDAMWTGKLDDEHTTVVFDQPGIYEIGVDCYGPGGSDGTSTKRLITVTA